MSLLKSKKIIFTSYLLVSSMLSSNLVSAQNLMETLQEAYNNNATINQNRAQLRLSAEDISMARSSFFPNLAVTGGYNYNWKKDFNTYNDGISVGAKLNQNLFSGFQIINNVAAAKAKSYSEAENLHSTEQNQLLKAITAYMDVYTSREIARLRKDDLAALDEQVRSNKARLAVGEGTRTDLAQAEASRARALSDLIIAQSSIKAAEASYRQVVGVEPADKLTLPQIADELPKTIEDAYEIAQTQHPAILSAKYMTDASLYNVKAAEGALLPNISLFLSTNYQKAYHGPDLMDGFSNTAGVQLSMPIFTGGMNYSKIRSSKEQLGIARLGSDIAQDSVRESLEKSWADFEGLRSSVSAFKDSVRAAKIALSGRMQEYKVGQATTLEVLNSRSQLITMQLSLINSEKQLIIASYGIKAAIGELTGEQLGLTQKNQDNKQIIEDRSQPYLNSKTIDGR